MFFDQLNRAMEMWAGFRVNRQVRRASFRSQALLEVDGGIKVENAAGVVKAGADVLVAGSAIFNTPNYAETIQAFRSAAHAQSVSL